MFRVRHRFYPALRRVVAFGLGCSFASSQVATPVATPAQGDQPFVVRINVNLVQVDVAVTDAKGQPVSDLKAEDFEVSQDGVPQTVTTFSYVQEGVKPAVPTPPASQGPVVVPPPPVSLNLNQVKRVIALVVDDLGLSPVSMAQIRSGLKKFVDHDMLPGDLVAIIRTGGGIGALQQFTTDKRLLYASIDHLKYNFNGRVGSFRPLNPAVLLDTSQTLTLPVAVSNPGELAQTPSATPNTAINGFGDGGSVASTVSDPEDSCSINTGSSVGSLAAVRYVVDGLRELPGRKALVLFSESLQMFEPPGIITTRPFVRGVNSGASEATNAWTCDYSRVRDSFRKLTDSAERAAVVIYTVDPRGVDPLMFDVADNPLAGVTTMQAAGGGNLPGQLSSKRQLYRETQEGLHALAEDTGGTFAVHNDMVGAIREAADDSANYYLIGYRPPASTFEQKAEMKFHKVEVKVRRAGVRVRSRSGFYGFPGRERNSPALSRGEQFAKGLVSPFAASDLHLRVTSFFSRSDKSFLTTLLYIDGGDITFTAEPNGQYKAVLEAVAVTFDENGRPVDDTQRVFTLRGDEHSRDLAIKNGLVLTVQHAAEKPGPYQMRVAVRDAESKKMGTATQFVEVPDLKRKKLAVSGILIKQEEAPAAARTPDSTQSVALDPKGNEAIRMFKPGEKIGWEFQIFNARKGNDQMPNLTVQTRFFRDGAEIARSEPMPVVFPTGGAEDHLAASGKILLGPRFVPGDYALQVIVTDTLAKKNKAVAFQSVDFSVVAN